MVRAKQSLMSAENLCSLENVNKFPLSSVKTNILVLSINQMSFKLTKKNDWKGKNWYLQVMGMCWSEYKDDSFHVGAMLTWLFKWEVYQSLERKEKGGRRKKDKRKEPNIYISFPIFFSFG